MKQENHEIIVSSGCEVTIMIDNEKVEDAAPVWLWSKVLVNDGCDILNTKLNIRLNNFVQMISIGLNWKLGETVKLIVCMQGKLFKFYYPVTKKKPREPIKDEPKYFNLEEIMQ